MKNIARPELTIHELGQKAQSIFTQEPIGTASERYTHISTLDLLKTLRKEGWYPVDAMQQKISAPGRRGFQRHLVKLVHEKASTYVIGGDAQVESYIINSHDRTTFFQLGAGMFRGICMNGLVIGKSLLPPMIIKHQDLNGQEVIAAAEKLLKNIAPIAENAERMANRVLKDDEKHDFANRALVMRYPTMPGSSITPPIKAEQLLEPRRQADINNSLWHVFNVIQENMIKGGLRGETLIKIADNAFISRWVTTQPITGITRSNELNQNLWDIAATYLN